MSPRPDLLAPLLHGEAAERIFASESQLGAMARFEIGLAYALEDVGVAPRGTGEACERGAENFPSDEQLEQIAQAARGSGNLAIPFVKLFTAHVRARSGDAADFIHYGATSQDLLDTVVVLQIQQICSLVSNQITRICTALTALIEQHRETLLPGRTWLQQGPPVTFALKAAQWLSAMLRHRERLAAASRRACVLQFGGAVGTLASLGEHGAAVARALAKRLELPLPDIPWHTERDALVEVGALLALLDGTLGKIARDLSLLMQNEVAEVQIALSGGSSTMPHKRNPVSLAVVLAAAVRAPSLASTLLAAMVQEHERGLGGWHAEWETLPDLCRITGGALEHMAATLETLQIDREAMRRNLDLLHGLPLAESVSMRLAPFIGRPAAHHLLETASRNALERRVSLLTVMRENAAVTKHLSIEALEEALDPAHYLGSANQFIDQVLAHAAQSQAKEHADALR